MAGLPLISRCGVCNRRLSDPASIAQGIGPVCAGRLTRAPLLPFPDKRFLAAAKATANHIAKRVRKAKARPAPAPAPIRWRYWSV
ncbi:MAG: DUF6011 domain-containing protein [Thermodesulfobacteriota bacterium]